MYTIKCDALNFKPTKSQKKVVKRFVNYILNDVKPGGSKSEVNEANEDHGDDGAEPSDNIQEKTESLEKNLQMKIEDMEVVNNSNKKPTHENDSSVSKPNCDKVGNETSKITEKANTAMKHPMGQDLTKPKQGKAKLRRLEKWKAKHGDLPDKKNDKNQEKSIEDLMQSLETAENPKHKWEMKLVPAYQSNPAFAASYDETVQVYQKYQQTIHNDSPDKCTERQYKRFLCNSPLQQNSRGPPHGSYHYQYCIDGKIVAVGVLDVLQHCISSVYLYYDPQYCFLSLGTLTSLLEICLVRKLAKTYPEINQYYLGFYIHNCVKMKYKGRYSPSYLLCPEVYSWQSIGSCTPLLDQSKYSRLDPDNTKGDVNAKIDLAQVGILYNRQATNYAVYQELLDEDDLDQNMDKDEVLEYAGFVGDTIARRMLLYRAI